MDDDPSDDLEKELEEQLEKEEQYDPFSTPRQRLEAAKAMAEGVASLEGNASLACYSEGMGGRASGGRQKDPFGTSMHTVVKDAYHGNEDSRDLMQSTKDSYLNNGEWKLLRDINFESQDVLAEINETLGSLQQWQKDRVVNAIANNPGERSIENALGTSCSGYTEPRSTSPRESGDADKEDYLFELWQEHQHRAEQAAERLMEQLRPARRPCNSNLAEADKHRCFTQQPQLALAQDLSIVEEESGHDRAAEIRRDIESLKIRQWIEDIRAGACDNALTAAGEACQEIWSGTEPVRDIETELALFTDELDSLLLRVDGCDSGSQDLAGKVVIEGASITADAAHREHSSPKEKYIIIGSTD